MMNNVSKKEKKIREIGGSLRSDYNRLRDIVSYVNTHFFPLFALMGFYHPEEKDMVIDAVVSEDIYSGAEKLYIETGMKNVESGKIGIEKLLSSRILQREYSTPEEKERKYKGKIHRALIFRYRKIEDTFKKEYNPPFPYFYKLPIKMFRDALSLTSEGFIIDAEKFIEVYTDYMEASTSATGKQHREIADAINRFFNGSVMITDKELERYFVLDNGIIKVNPRSVNTESYLRLGYKGKVKISKVK